MIDVEIPVRVADVGGWTDTWFAAPGAVCHLPVLPGVRVRAELRERAPSDAPVVLDAPGVSSRYALGGAGPWTPGSPLPGRHPLLEQAVASVLDADPSLLPAGTALRLTITSPVPAGASTGTSASVVVGLLTALDLALRSRRRAPDRLAHDAHQVEVGRCGLESGVQDQWAATHGVPALVEVPAFRQGETPAVRHTPLTLSPETAQTLDQRLVTVALGSHSSSAVHREVIEAIHHPESDHGRVRACLADLRELAYEAAAALPSGDLSAWADTLRRATATQQRMHPGLTGAEHHRAIALAADHGALGWKVNGAGGEGGSLTALAPDAEAAAALATAWSHASPAWSVLPARLAAGPVGG